MKRDYLAPYHCTFTWGDEDSIQGTLVELFGDEGEWYYVESDNGDRVEVVSATSKLAIPPREIVSKRFILRIK